MQAQVYQEMIVLHVKVKLQCNENGMPYKGTIVPSKEAPKIGPLSVVTDSGPRSDAGCPR